MKKGISYLLLLSALFAFSSCGEQPHTHSPSSDWSYDNTSHWHACSGCEELLDKENHKWNDGVETTFATDTDGVITYTCKICNTTKEEGVSAFSKVGELEQKSWSSFEGFTMYAKRDSYSVNLRFLADNTVFTSLNRNSKLEVYISTGKNVSQLNGNGGVTRITVY